MAGGIGGALAAGVRSYPTSGAPAQPANPPDYLPSSGMMGSLFGMAPDPVTRGPGKSIMTQHLGTVVGRRGAGISQFQGNQGAHALGHYAKGGLSDIRKMSGGTF